MLLLHILLLGAFLSFCPTIEGHPVTHASCNDLVVSIAVSSLVLTDTPRQLELSWEHAAPVPDDYLGLFDDIPTASSLPIRSIPVIGSIGHGVVDISAPITVSSQLSFQSQCLGYWVAYMRGEQILASSCLKTQPSWMSDMKEDIRDLKLSELFLPGTHDAASYKNYTSADDNIVTKNAITQEEDILSQLIHGIRYMDMRIVYFANTEEPWWTDHGVVPMHPLSDILEQVKYFIDHSDEIIIFDIHGLTGFNSDAIHDAFITWLQVVLEGYMADSELTWDTTLGSIWQSERRLIVTYEDNTVGADHSFLWQNVKHEWGNKQNVEDLYSFLQDTILDPPSLGARPWSAMAELTATPANVALDTLGGLRQMADNVNRNVTSWFRDSIWGTTANIVAVDFFRGSGIVEEAIQWNQRRASGVPCF